MRLQLSLTAPAYHPGPWTSRHGHSSTTRSLWRRRATTCQQGSSSELQRPQRQQPNDNGLLARWRQPAVTLLAGITAAANVLLASPADIAAHAAVLTRDEVSTIKLFQQSAPSVVYITNLATRRDAFTMDILEIPQGAGSGFVWDKQGHIVTNYHVCKGAADLLVTVTDGREYNATVVGFDEDKDVAVLKLKTNGDKLDLRPIQLGTSGDLQVGQRVFAIGNPFGLDHTLTTGVVSGLGREIASGTTGRPIQDVIQTDAAINPGNSGGPLLDSGGHLIGVNTAIYSPSGANSGVGFAIPVDIVKSSAEQIIKFGKVVRPIMGISFAPDQSVEQLGLSGGVLVLDARDGGPASKAGIRGTSRDEYGRLVLGDIILSVDGVKIKTGSDLYRALDKKLVGDSMDVEVLRGDDKVHVALVLEASG